jgi:hypothetical protein
MNYRIYLNIPHKKHLTEVLVNQVQLDALEKAIESRKIVKIGKQYFHTAYIVKITPDTDRNVLEEANTPRIERYSEGTQRGMNKKGMESLRDNLKKRGLVK